MNIEEQKRIWGDIKNWKDDGNEWSIYYGNTDKLYEIIEPKIKKYLKGNVLEIAPGFGRMTKLLLRSDINLDIVDLNNICIIKCVELFGNKINTYKVNDGKSLNYNCDYYDFVFSYDSFVHITSDIIEMYIKDISRILRKGGYAFIHHSYFNGNIEPSKNKAGRSNMSPKLFKTIVENNNMKVISQEIFTISNEVNDTITIFKK